MKTVINNNERVFLVVDSFLRMTFCNTSEVNTVCKDLREGYFKIYHFHNGKQTKTTKKNLKIFLEGYGLKQEFLY
jgi:hypothetical protein